METQTAPSRPRQPQPLVSAWCLGCNRRLPRARRGFCTYCLRTFNRSDRGTFRAEPLRDDGPNHGVAILTALAAASVYLVWNFIDGYVVTAIWHTEARWPIGWLALVALQTWLVTLLILMSLRHTGYDRLMVLWTAGVLLGGLLALPHGAVALLVGMVVGVPAAIIARAVSLGIEVHGHGLSFPS